MELPYRPRQGQQGLVAMLRKAHTDGRHAVIEAGTGTGKTVAALVAALTVAITEGRRVLYVTRTNSQQAQVVREHRALHDAGMDPGLLIPFMGRRQYCPLLRDDARFADGTPEELGRLCRDAKRKAVRALEEGRDIEGTCPYYKRLLVDGTAPVQALLETGGQDARAISRRITACGSCPYEALKALLPKARTVVVPSIFVVDGRLRDVLCTWLGVGLDEVHVIIDEAHHLPEAARDHHSPRLTMMAIRRALREAEDYQDPVLAGRILTTSLLHALQAVIGELAETHAIGEDGRIPPGALQEGLLEHLRVPTPVIKRAARDLEAWGETIREDRRRKGRLPRSLLGAVGAFLDAWTMTDERPYAHLVTAGENPAVEGLLLEPSVVLGWLHECASSVHISGTLAPPDGHVRSCGLPEDTVTHVFPSPYRDRLRIVGVEGVHRRWQLHQDDPVHAARQQDAARAVLTLLPGKTALFFPSHAMCQDWLEEGFLHELGRSVYAEKADMSAAEAADLVAAFRQDKRTSAILLGVLGGRSSEGLDFPGDELRNVILLGIPYPRPTARLQALIDHNDRIHDGKGWRLVVHDPTGRLMRQAVGRLVRSPDDHGTAVILDERVVRFGGHLEGLEMVADVDVVPAVLREQPSSSPGFRPATLLAGPSGESKRNNLKQKPG